MAIDEQQLLFEASCALNRAENRSDLDAAWREHIAPAWESLEPETQEILSRLYSLKLSTLSWSV